MQKLLKSLLFSIGICILMPHALFSLEYGLLAKNEGEISVKKLAVLGERCSGTNFIMQLLYTNLAIYPGPFCHKHFPPWYSLPAEQYFGHPSHYNFEYTDDYLFVIIFRNPYDWIRSFHLTPWHSSLDLHEISFSKFIRSTWELNMKDPSIIKQKGHNPLIDKNPATGEPFENPLKLRTAKIKNMLMIKDKAKHVYYVNYEIARDHPEEVLAEISTFFNIYRDPQYKPVVHYKGYSKFKVYEKKEYDPISKIDMKFINAQLDEKLENKIGYQLQKPYELRK